MPLGEVNKFFNLDEIYALKKYNEFTVSKYAHTKKDLITKEKSLSNIFNPSIQESESKAGLCAA